MDQQSIFLDKIGYPCKDYQQADLTENPPPAGVGRRKRGHAKEKAPRITACGGPGQARQARVGEENSRIEGQAAETDAA